MNSAVDIDEGETYLHILHEHDKWECNTRIRHFHPIIFIWIKNKMKIYNHYHVLTTE